MHYDYHQQHDKDDSADHTELLARRGENEVVMLTGKHIGRIARLNAGQTPVCK